MGVIYVRPNLINGKKYVGLTTDLKTRQYNWNNLNQPYAGPAINNARAKYGIDNFGFEILKECEDEELDYWEKYYIKELNTKVPNGYNLTDGGDGCKGYHHTDEYKKKMSEAVKGEKNHMYGKHHGEETKKKMSKVHKGIKHTEEARKKMSEAAKGNQHCLGIKHSEETRKKMSEAVKGRYKGIYNTKLSKSVLQYDIDGNFIKEWPSMAEIERQLEYCKSAICTCCHGKCKQAYGFIWKYTS